MAEATSSGSATRPIGVRCSHKAFVRDGEQSGHLNQAGLGHPVWS